MNILRQLLPVTLSLLSAASVAAQIDAYHDVDGATHQQRYGQLSTLGYRMLSLSIYGTTASPRYAAVWIRRAGPAFVGCHGVTAAEWSTFFNTYEPLGYRPTILSATGPGSNPRIAAVMELNNAAGWTAHGVTEAQYTTARNAAISSGFDVRAVDVYGAGTDSRYIATFAPVGGQSAIRSATAADYQLHYMAMREGHARPVLVGFNDDQRYVSLWRSDDVGEVRAMHGMTGAVYQARYNDYIAEGFYPISLQGSGSGAATRYAAVWARTDQSLSRRFTATGDSVRSLAAFDTWAQTFMQASETRAASLAVVKDGRLVLARGYTFAESGYPITQPTSLFAIASCSKPLTSIAIHQQIQRRAMTHGTAMMNFFPGLIQADARVAFIDLDALLTHQGGWDSTISPDPMIGQDPTIATTWSVPLPISKSHILRYMVGTQLLDWSPYQRSVYSNFGFSVLGMVLESQYPGSTYADVVQRDVFAPLGIQRPRIGGSRFAERLPGEVLYHPYKPWIAQTVTSPERPWVGAQYGAWNEANMDSHGGWVMAAPDYAKVLAAFDLGGNNPILGAAQTTQMWTPARNLPTTLRGWFLASVDDGRGGMVDMVHHNGLLAGCRSFIARRADGLSFVFLTNGDGTFLGGDTHGGQLSAIANTIPIWPNGDLFPSVNLPSLRTYMPGAINTFGVACSGTNGVPTLAGQGTPDVGQAMSFRISNGPASRPALLLLGTQLTTLSLTPFGAPGCTLYTDPILAWPTATDAAGSATVPWLVPNSSSLVGLLVLSQAALVDPAGNALGLVTTNGVDVQLGGWR